MLPLLQESDFVKIDIEGSEWAIFGDPRFETMAARVVALEYHPQGCPEPDPRLAAMTVFERLGYVIEEIAVPHAPPGVGMLWAWRLAVL
ncbi:MAG: FkbM family methyltransferase [Actinobacteria bacterium]|nr:FkbM family methyltransferase [Actinomycetota bacterium]